MNLDRVIDHLLEEETDSHQVKLIRLHRERFNVDDEDEAEMAAEDKRYLGKTGTATPVTEPVLGSIPEDPFDKMYRVEFTDGYEQVFGKEELAFWDGDKQEFIPTEVEDPASFIR